MVDRLKALADTSIFVGLETGRIAYEDIENYDWGLSVVTLGELRHGVLMAPNPAVGATRLATLQVAQQCEAIPIDEQVSEAWAALVAQLRSSGRKAPINDTWIAATAIAHRIPLVTQDKGYDGMPDLEVILA